MPDSAAESEVRKPPGYHVKTDGRAYFRPIVPTRLKAAVGKLPMVNLELKDGREAIRAALVAYRKHLQFLEEFERDLQAEQALLNAPTRRLDAMTVEDRQAFAADLAQAFNRTQYAALRGRVPREELLRLHELVDAGSGDVLSGVGEEAVANWADLFLTAANITHRRDDAAFQDFVFDFAEALNRHFVEPSRTRLIERKAVPPPPLPAARTLPQPEPEAPGLTLGRCVDDYVSAIKENGYKRKIKRCLELFRDRIGPDVAVTALRQRDVTQFLRDICRLPKDWATVYQHGGVSLAELFESSDVEGMSPKTYTDNYRAPLKAFLIDSARDHGDVGFPSLVVDRLEYQGDRTEAEDKQRHFEPGELKRIFEGVEFKRIAADPAQQAAYWLPVIALYSGARPREICQLNPQCDWGEQEGVPFLFFSPHTAAGPGIKKTIKMGEERMIPMHPELVRLGLPAYLQRLKDEGAERIFADVRVKKGNPFEVAGAAFTDFLRQVGVYDDTAAPGRRLLGMYAFRKTFITYCDQQGVISREITGHSDTQLTETQRRYYVTAPESLHKKDAQMRKLVMPVTVPARPSGS